MYNRDTQPTPKNETTAKDDAAKKAAELKKPEADRAAADAEKNRVNR